MCKTESIVSPDEAKDFKHVVDKHVSFPSAKSSDSSSLEESFYFFFSLKPTAEWAPEQPDVTSHLVDSFAPPIF